MPRHGAQAPVWVHEDTPLTMQPGAEIAQQHFENGVGRPDFLHRSQLVRWQPPESATPIVQRCDLFLDQPIVADWDTGELPGHSLAGSEAYRYFLQE